MPESISHERLLELLDYFRISGAFKWKQRRRPQSPVGSVAGWWCNSTQSYRVEVDNKIYLAHRLAWFYVNRVWPTDQIDHKDRNRRNNSILNLREADNGQNQANMPAKSNNSTGFRGVGKSGNSYIVQLYKIMPNGENKKVWASFKDFEEAKIYAQEQSKLLHAEFSYFSESA